MLDDLPTLRAQRDAFMVAAEREIAASSRPRRQRRLRRGSIAVVAATVLGVGGVAVATELIAIGQPSPDAIDRRVGEQPAGGLDIAVTAADTPLPWAVGTFTSNDGSSCALVGQLRGSSLGLIRDGAFRPFADNTGGACRGGAGSTRVVDNRREGNRFVMYGLAPPGTRTITLVERSGASRTATAGRAGAFLFLYDAATDAADFAEITYRDAAGRRLP